MPSILRPFVFSVLCFLSLTINAQSLPSYWSGIKKGSFAVGFKSLCVFDTSRKYDLACGDSVLKKTTPQLGRPILLNIWYPAKKRNDTTVLKVKDYFEFPSDVNTKLFFSKLKAYQLEYSQLYTVNGNMKRSYAGDSSLFEKSKAAAFEKYLSSNTLSHRNAAAAEGLFPVIIYHVGAGGTMDENNLLFEYLASNGYIVINSAFQESDGSDPDGWNVGVGDQKATFDDLNFIISYTKKNHLSQSKKVFLMGHSYGANSALSFVGQGYKNVDGVIPLDTDFGYELNGFYPPEFNPLTQEKKKFYHHLPIFCIGRNEAHFRLVDSLSSSQRFYLTIPNMRHNDFTSQGAIGRFYCLPYIKDKPLYEGIIANYLEMCSEVLLFLNYYSKTGSGFTKNNLHLAGGWTFAHEGPGKKLPGNRTFNTAVQNCPTISQFIDLVYYGGMEKSKIVYAKCTDTSFKKTENLLTVLYALYNDASAERIIAYLDWMNEQKAVADNMRDIFLTFSRSSLFNSGNGFHFEMADSMYNWMMQKFPSSKYGYLGKLLIGIYTKKDNKEFYARKLLEVDPDFENSKTTSSLERTAKQFIVANRKSL